MLYDRVGVPIRVLYYKGAMAACETIVREPSMLLPGQAQGKLNPLKNVRQAALLHFDPRAYPKTLCPTPRTLQHTAAQTLKPESPQALIKALNP